MADGLRPYLEYKDSGLPWLGNIPTHWMIRRLRHCGGIIGGSTPSMKRPDFWNGSVPWVSPKDMKLPEITDSRDHITQAAVNEAGIKLIEPPAILFVVRGMILAKRVPIAVTRVPVTINQDMKAILPGPNVYAEFLVYALEAAKNAFFEMIDEAGHGTKRLPTARWRQLEIAFPPVDEQKLIANYLDAKSRQIRRFIRNKRQLIERLNEQKQAIINRAVTKGLEPTARLKPSGIDWLGDVPEHWEVVKLRHAAKFNPSKSEANIGNRLQDPVVFLPMEKISESGAIDCSEQREILDVSSGYTYFKRDDVVIAKITPCFENGKGAYLGELETDIGFGTTELFVLRAESGMLPRYLYLLTMTSAFRLLGAEYMTGSAGQQRVPLDFVKNFQIGLPPMEEQQQILDFIDEEHELIEATVQRAQREIDLIREYRTRLITDVVTGKVDVRHLAEGLDVEADTDGLEDDDADLEDAFDDEDVVDDEELSDADD